MIFTQNKFICGIGSCKAKKRVSKSELLLKIKFKENISEDRFISVKYIIANNCFLAENHRKSNEQTERRETGL